MSETPQHPTIVFDPEKASIYDNAPPGALMPWKRGTEPHPGWEWAEDLAQFEAAIYAPGAEAGWYGWIRRKSAAKEIAEALTGYFARQPVESARVRFLDGGPGRCACEGLVEVRGRFGTLDEDALREERERVGIPHDARILDVEWSGGRASVRYGWGTLP